MLLASIRPSVSSYDQVVIRKSLNYNETETM